jgi:hypothetical protein
MNKHSFWKIGRICRLFVNQKDSRERDPGFLLHLEFNAWNPTIFYHRSALIGFETL